MSLKTPKVVYSASERQHTAAGEDKYLEVVFTSDGSRNKGINTRAGEANAVLREFCRSVVTKRELLKTTKLSVCKPVFVPILTHGHEF